MPVSPMDLPTAQVSDWSPPQPSNTCTTRPTCSPPWNLCWPNQGHRPTPTDSSCFPLRCSGCTLFRPLMRGLTLFRYEIQGAFRERDSRALSRRRVVPASGRNRTVQLFSNWQIPGDGFRSAVPDSGYDEWSGLARRLPYDNPAGRPAFLRPKTVRHRIKSGR